MKINEVKEGQGQIELTAKVIDKGDVREFTKFGKTGKVCNVVIEDDTGKISLTLWNEDVDKVNVGDTIKLVNGYANSYQGEIQLTAGRFGNIEITEKGETAVSEPAETSLTEETNGPDTENVEEETIK